MTGAGNSPDKTKHGPSLAGPVINPAFQKALDELVDLAGKGQRAESEFFNPSPEWLADHMRLLENLPQEQRKAVLDDWARIAQDAEDVSKVLPRSGPDAVFRLDSGGLAFFSQLGVARRPDLTRYFIDGFARNRDALAFTEDDQALFAEVIPYITGRLREHFASGDTVVQTDRQVGDAPGRSFHARQLVFGTGCLQVAYMWRQLTFDLPEERRTQRPDILEVSVPYWLYDLGIPDDLRERIVSAGLTQLVFKAPTKGLSLHLGFDYVGEHKMGPLSIAMFLVKEAGGLALQAALSVARIKTLDGQMANTALVTAGPSLHGKSTLTIMMEPSNSELAGLLGLANDPGEGVYPMNDDIVLLQPLADAIETQRGGKRRRISHGIDGTENSFYAVPYGLTREDDPVAYDVVRGSEDSPNPQETLENVLVTPEEGAPDFQRNPTRNMRVTMSRRGLLERKGVHTLLEAITDGQSRDSVHVPMEHVDRVFWQGVMRQNTVIPPLRRLSMEQYIRTLMYGEAVQMGAAAGVIGRPYVEYFSDPFIIGLEDENANLLYQVLRELDEGGMAQEFYVFNTGGIGADSNEEAAGEKYNKIPKELTLMLQEALLRGAIRYEYDAVLGSEVATAIVDARGNAVVDLQGRWLPREVYGTYEYALRIQELKRRRYYGRDAQDRAGILRYTKVTTALLDLDDIPPPADERELAWLLSYCWQVDQAYGSLAELAQHLDEGQRPPFLLMGSLGSVYTAAIARGLELSNEAAGLLGTVGLEG